MGRRRPRVCPAARAAKAFASRAMASSTYRSVAVTLTTDPPCGYPTCHLPMWPVTYPALRSADTAVATPAGMPSGPKSAFGVFCS
eukprot:scaffold196200_cov29-Tisochrysis_lutea.AAC.3